jgi:hypothetical protein
MATIERGIHSSLAGNGSMERCQLSLIACGRCLRVVRDETWVLAELVIRELRSFEYGTPPRFEPMLCLVCVSSIAQRRGNARVPLERDLVRSSGRR